MSIIPDYIELPEDEEVIADAEEATSNTWVLDETTKTIKPISDDRRESIVQMAKCMLRTEIQEYEMYSIDFGSRLHELLGETKPHVYAEIQKTIEKCLALDERINKVSNFSFEEHHGVIKVSFDMDIMSETVRMEQEVNYG